MLAVGADKIKGLYVGEQKITAAYLGGEQVFSGKKPSRLPEGYTEVAYIEVSGSIQISSGTTINPSTARIVMDVETKEKVDSKEYIFVCNSSGSGSSLRTTWLYRSSATALKYYQGYSGGTDTQISVSFPTGQRAQMDFDWAGKKVTINGASKNLSNSSYITGTFFFFSSKATKCLPCKLYSAQIYKNGVLSKEFVPCVEDASGNPGLFDLTASVFRPNISTYTGTITAGPAV